MSDIELHTGGELAAEIAALDAAAADFSIEDFEDMPEIPEVVEEAVVEAIAPEEVTITEIASSTELDALDAEIAKSEVYEETEAGGAIDMSAPVAPAEAKTEKVKKERKPREAPTMTRDLSALPPEAFTLFTSETPSDEIKADVILMRPAIKKIAEKFDNMIVALHAGRKPSTYAVQAFQELDKRKSLTNTELVAYFTGDRSYSKGTAGSQAGQIMALFPLLGIATKDGKALKLREDSVFAEKLRRLITTPAAA